jgi:GNAT superfamily N-acetyltransferase
MIELRAISADDWEQWRALRLRALAEAPYAFGSRIEEWVDASEERWRQRLSLPGAVSMIARLAGRDVGMASGIPSDDVAVAELVSMWVAPEARGQGVGDLLVTTIVTWAQEHGATTLRLDVTDANAHASALYARHGFVALHGLREDGERTMVKALVPTPSIES